MPSIIPIQNVYYLLCYAWDELEQGELIDVGRVQSTELVDLCALVLCDGVRHLARLGLEQGYELLEEELTGVRGRIDLTTSGRRALFIRGRLHCEFDELTANTLANRIIRTTLRSLVAAEELDDDLRRRVHATARDMRGIEPIELTDRLFKTIRVHSNARFYRFLINVCEIIHDSLLVDETKGTSRFRDFLRDDAKMAVLFENFLRNFIARECRQWNLKRENIAWRASSETDPTLALLPRMQTDISLSRPGEHLIVDAKYYREALSAYFDAEKLRNAHLYQLLSYLLNARAQPGVLCSGMLVYPRVDRELRERYEILGRKIAICTVDLNRPWGSIDREIRELFV